VQDINLYHLLKFYAKNWLWIVLVTGIGVLAGVVYNNYIQTPLYKSGATLLLISPVDKKVTQDVTLLNNYVELFKSRRVLEPVIAKQNLDLSYDTLVKSIETTNEKNTEVIKVAISTENAQTSRALVEGAVESFKEQITQLYDIDNVKIVDDASLAITPYNVHKERVLAIATVAGLVVVLTVLFFAYDLTLTKKSTKKPTVKRHTHHRTHTMRRIATMLLGTAEPPPKKKPAKKK
jgi:capsular polysaccharide biosynthesis protein